MPKPRLIRRRDIKKLLTGVQWAVTKRKVIRNATFIFQLYLQVKQEYYFLTQKIGSPFLL